MTNWLSAAALGSPTAVSVLKANGALPKVYSTDLGVELFGTFIWRAYDDYTEMHLSAQKGGKFLYHPEHQEHHFQLNWDIAAHKNVYVLSGSPGQAGMHFTD